MSLKQSCLQLFYKFLSKSLSTRRITICLGLMLLSQQPVTANDTVLIKKLQSAEFISLTDAFENNDIIMLFQPDCAVCKAQIEKINGLKNFKLLGTNGSEQRLREDYNKFKTDVPAFSIDLKTLKKISPKLQIVTPQFFKVKKTQDKPFILKNLGYGLKSCKELN